jgi:hypothetical protein
VIVKLRGWAVVRLLLIVVWVATAVAAWWTAPRSETFDHARADIAAGRVVAYQWGTGWNTDIHHDFFRPPTLRNEGKTGPYFVWRTSGGRVHWTDTSDFEQVTDNGTIDGKQYSGPGAVRIAEDLLAAHLDTRVGSTEPLNMITAAGNIVLVFGFLIILIFGPTAPVRGTKWFWFWLVTGIPFGIGLLVWLFRDRPGAAVEPRLDDRTGQPDRRRWYLGILLGIGGSILVELLLWGAGSVLGSGVVPVYP